MKRMSDGSISQEEIDALLKNGDNTQKAGASSNEESLTTQEMDTIGEVSNICMGTAATALFSLVNKKVEISTPVVSLATWKNIIDEYEKPCVLIKIIYTKGLNGSNELVLKESDVRVITDLMMGGTGENVEGELTDIHLSAISEAMNQMMGASATSISSMLSKTVDISPPTSTLIRLETVEDASELNELVLKESDVRVITDLMMGGTGENVEGELTDIHLSAISEAMNQMMGASATSISSMLSKTVDISPPTSTLIRLETVEDASELNEFLNGTFVKIEFRLQIGDLVDSKIMQLYPISLVKQMCTDVANTMEADTNASTPKEELHEVGQVPQSEMQMGSLETESQERNDIMANNQSSQQMNNMGQPNQGKMAPREQVNVQSANFAAFQNGNPVIPLQENIDLIKNVPLEVTVELGRTLKSIQEILDFAPGTIIELNKIAGEPIDVLVNGKYVAKGEVVVIEESFGIRITEILTNV